MPRSARNSRWIDRLVEFGASGCAAARRPALESTGSGETGGAAFQLRIGADHFLVALGELAVRFRFLGRGDARSRFTLLAGAITEMLQPVVHA